ncbi:alpha/beta hydrolase, partial [Candidatus Woesearchaeota archaeon]
LKIYYNYLNKGSKKPTLVFIHGWMVNWTCFKDEINHFKKLGFPIIYMDLRGHGKSSKPTNKKYYSINLMAKDIKRILSHHNIRKPILIGHSMGGMVALYYNVKYKVKKSIVINSVYRNPLIFSRSKYLRKKRRVLKKIISSLLMFVQGKKIKDKKFLDYSKFKKDSDKKIFIKSLLNTPLVISLSTLYAMYNYDVKDKIPFITNDILIITSRRDQFFTKHLSRDFSRVLPNAKIITKNATHGILKNSAKILKEIEEFVTS